MATKTIAIFYYDITKFFDLSSLESMYRTDQDKDQSGVSNLDYHSLTLADKNFYDKILKRAAGECFNVLQPLARGLTEGVLYDDLPKRTVEELNDMVAPVESLRFQLTDAGTLTYGNVAVVKGNKVYYNGSVWVTDNATTLKYILFTLAFPSNFDGNLEFSLDNKIEEFIVSYTMREWFKRQKYDLSLVESEYQIARIELSRILNYRTFIKRVIRTF